MPQIVDIRQADDPRDLIHRAVQRLAEGQLVAFPTETCYLVTAAALQPAAVRQLLEVGGGPGQTLLIKSAAEALDYFPEMSRLGKKLARRCWPGPVGLQFSMGDGPEHEKMGLWAALPVETQTQVAPGGRLTLRVPGHELLLEVLRLLPAPLVAADELDAQGMPAVTVPDLVARFGERLALVLDDGPCRYAQPASIAAVNGESWELVREGVVGARTLGRLAGEVVLFVCTGNTCRSPMAEGMFRKLLSDRLNCPEDGLVDRGFVVASAGLAAGMGGGAAPEAMEVLQRRGIDLRSHESQPLTLRLLSQADRVFTMTNDHRDAILRDDPSLADRVMVLSRDGGNISDPIGHGFEKYVECADEIERHLKLILNELLDDPRQQTSLN